MSKYNSVWGSCFRSDILGWIRIYIRNFPFVCVSLSYYISLVLSFLSYGIWLLLYNTIFCPQLRLRKLLLRCVRIKTHSPWFHYIITRSHPIPVCVRAILIPFLLMGKPSNNSSRSGCSGKACQTLTDSYCCFRFLCVPTPRHLVIKFLRPFFVQGKPSSSTSHARRKPPSPFWYGISLWTCR